MNSSFGSARQCNAAAHDECDAGDANSVDFPWPVTAALPGRRAVALRVEAADDFHGIAGHVLAVSHVSTHHSSGAAA